MKPFALLLISLLIGLDQAIALPKEDKVKSSEESSTGIVTDAITLSTLAQSELLCHVLGERDSAAKRDEKYSDGRYIIGSCTDFCEEICFNYESFDISDSTCTCGKPSATIQTETHPITNITTPPIDGRCGEHAFINDAGNCVCVEGYQGKNPTVKCIDIDECAFPEDPCVVIFPNSHCLNTKGSHRCLCDDGYHGSPAQGFQCWSENDSANATLEGSQSETITSDMQSTNDTMNQSSTTADDMENAGNDIDVCKSDDNPCGDFVHSFCVSNQGNFTCKCDDGFAGDPLQGEECTLTCEFPDGSPCGPDLCIDTPDGYACEPSGISDGCEVECSPSMHCASVKDPETKKMEYHCVCNPGYYQTSPFLPCIPEEN